MKNYLLLILSLTLTSCILFEKDEDEINESEFVGDVILETQQEIDDFGANNYTSIIGKLEIGNLFESNSSVKNLNSLKSLTSVSKNLFIVNNDSLKNIDGLSNLTSIGLYLSINHNMSLQTLDGLNKLNYVGATLQVKKNDKLENIDGFMNLNIVGENIMLTENLNLKNIEGMKNVTTFNGSLHVAKNPSLTSLQGVNNITSVYHLMIGHNTLITNLDALDNIKTIDAEGRIDVLNNANLMDLCGIKSIVSPDNYVIAKNQYNPTYQNFVDNNCSQ